MNAVLYQPSVELALLSENAAVKMLKEEIKTNESNKQKSLSGKQSTQRQTCISITWLSTCSIVWKLLMYGLSSPGPVDPRDVLCARCHVCKYLCVRRGTKLLYLHLNSSSRDAACLNEGSMSFHTPTQVESIVFHTESVNKALFITSKHPACKPGCVSDT